MDCSPFNFQSIVALVLNGLCYNISSKKIHISGCFIYILDRSNSFQSHFDLVSSVLALEATEPVSEPVTHMAVELINNHFVSV